LCDGIAVNGAKRNNPHDEEIEGSLRRIKFVCGVHTCYFYIYISMCRRSRHLKYGGRGVLEESGSQTSKLLNLSMVVANRPNRVSRSLFLETRFGDFARIELGSSSCPGAHRDVESSEAQLSSTREQITFSLVGKVNRDGTGIGVSCQDCVARIGRKARESNGSPATSNGHGCGGKFSSRSPVENEHRSALRAGDHDRLRSVARKVASGDAVGPRQSARGSGEPGMGWKRPWPSPSRMETAFSAGWVRSR